MIVPAALMLGYLLGSIPFGLLLTRLAGAGDIRAIGSGNIGATNVLRTGRKGLAAATLLLDAAKGFAAVALVGAWAGILAGHAPTAPLLAGAGAMIGHCFPVWLGFRGGKGVATMLGVCLALSGLVGLVYALVWLGAMGLTRVSSLGGLSAAVSAPIAAVLGGRFDLALVLALLAVLVVFQHRANIARLIAGTEPRFGGNKATDADG